MCRVLTPCVGVSKVKSTLTSVHGDITTSAGLSGKGCLWCLLVTLVGALHYTLVVGALHYPCSRGPTLHPYRNLRAVQNIWQDFSLPSLCQISCKGKSLRRLEPNTAACSPTHVTVRVTRGHALARVCCLGVPKVEWLLPAARPCNKQPRNRLKRFACHPKQICRTR